MESNRLAILQDLQNDVSDIRKTLAYEIKPWSLYYPISEYIELYRLTMRNRAECLIRSPRCSAVKAFIDSLGGQIQQRKNVEELDYITYYRYDFPVKMKPTSKEIDGVVLEKDGERLTDVSKFGDSTHVNGKILFWRLPEWRNIGDLSFIENDRQRKILTTILKSISDNIRIAFWEVIRYSHEHSKLLDDIDKCFIDPVNVSATKQLKYKGLGSWLKNIAYLERW